MKYLPLPAIVSLFMVSFCARALHLNNTEPGIYMVTDRDHYAPGETIQLQVFMLYPGTSSNNSVFVELLDCTGKLVSSKLLPTTRQTAWTSITLPNDFPGDHCLLYCYTAGPGKTANVTAIKKIYRKKQAPSPSTTLLLNVACEGNSFIAGCPNRLLVRCTDENGRPKRVACKLLNEKNELFSDFQTNEDGYIRLSISPEPNSNYHIIARDVNGLEVKTALPPVMNTGITFRITTGDTSFNYAAYSFTENEKMLDNTLIVLHNGDTVYTSSISFVKGLSMVSEDIAFAKLPEGFLDFRITGSNRMVMAQRVVYNWPAKENGSLIRIVDTLSGKEAVVHLPAYVNGSGLLSIIPITGNINTEQPWQQVLMDNNSATAATFNEHLIAAASAPIDHRLLKDTVNRYLSIGGRLVYADQKPVKNKAVNVIIIQKDGKKDFLFGVTDKNGRLQLNNLLFYDSARIYYQLADKSDERNQVSMNLMLSPAPDTGSYEKLKKILVCSTATAANNNLQTQPAVVVDKQSGNLAGSIGSVKTLQEVTVSGEKVQPKTEAEKFEEKYVAGQYRGNNFMRSQFSFLDNPQLSDNTPLLRFIQGRMNGFFVRYTRNGIPIIVSTMGDKVGVFVDDMEIDPNDLEMLNTLMVRDIALVKYYSMTKVPSTTSQGGSLMIYTRRDYTIKDPAISAMPRALVSGYSAEDKSATTITTGSASCLYWKPGFDPARQSMIYMRLPDQASQQNFRVVIEGVNKTMVPYRFVQSLVFL